MRFAFAVLTATLLGGCTTFQRWSAVEPLTAIEAKVEYCTWLKNEYPGSTEITNPLCGDATNTVDDERSGRDYLINLMMVADRVCARDLARMSSDQRTINASLSTTSTALSSAASIVTGGLADNILSGGAALLGASRDHINAEVYRTTQPEIVTLLIQTDREEIAKALLATEPKRTFTQQEAIYYANKYHQACSQYHGLALLSEAASNKAEEIKKQQSSMRSISIPEKSEKPTEENDEGQL